MLKVFWGCSAGIGRISRNLQTTLKKCSLCFWGVARFPCCSPGRCREVTSVDEAPAEATGAEGRVKGALGSAGLGADGCGTRWLRRCGCWWAWAGLWAGAGSRAQARCRHPPGIGEGSLTGLSRVGRAEIRKPG